MQITAEYVVNTIAKQQAFIFPFKSPTPLHRVLLVQQFNQQTQRAEEDKVKATANE